MVLSDTQEISPELVRLFLLKGGRSSRPILCSHPTRLYYLPPPPYLHPTASQVEIFLDVADPDDVIIPKLETLSVGESPWEGIFLQTDSHRYSALLSGKQHSVPLFKVWARHCSRPSNMC